MLVVGGLAAATIFTGGAVVAAAFVGATVSGTIGAVAGYMDDGWDGAANGFMIGTIFGATSGTVTALGLSPGVTIAINLGLDVGEACLDSILSGNDFSLTAVAIGTIFNLGGEAMGYLMNTKVVKNLFKKIHINLPRILSDEVYFKEIQDELNDVIEREQRRANQKYANKQMAKAYDKYSDDLANELLVYWLQETRDGIVDEIVEGKIEEITRK